MPFSRTDILGVPVDLASEADALDFVTMRLEERAQVQIVTVNAEFVVRAQRDPEFMQALQSARLATPDGAGILWALRRRGVRLPGRVGGSDLIWRLSELAEARGWRVFFLGAAPGVAAAVAFRMRSCYPGLKVTGVYSGSPSRDDEAHILDLIRRRGADILFVAFGAPAQELWIARNLGRTGVRVAIGVGGSFDYVAGVAVRSPRWMQRVWLDWLWRLARQPRRWRRMLAIPQFMWMVASRERGGDAFRSVDT